MNISAELQFIGVGCNRLGGCADWGRNGLVAYGAHRFVALYDVDATRVVATLRGHTKRVNCVKWMLHEGSEEQLLASAAADGSVHVWGCSRPGARMELKQTLSGSTMPALSLASVAVPRVGTGVDWLLVCTHSDSSVVVWRRLAGSDAWEEQSCGSLCNQSVECTALALLPSSSTPVLALGGLGGAGGSRGSEITLYILLDSQEEQGMARLSPHRLRTLKGHEDWIRGMAFATCDDGSLMLASSSQDKYIRLWRLRAQGTGEEAATVADNQPAAEEDALLSMLAAISPEESLASRQRAFQFEVAGCRYSVVLESVLCGHEDWVYSVCWQPATRDQNGVIKQPLCLLSASMDKTMMIWRPNEEEGGVWMNEVRVGERGGNTLGFYGGLFSPDGKSILGHGYNGAFHLWHLEEGSAQPSWEPQVTVSGHFGPVTGCSWDIEGAYLLSVSQDQTARIFAEWIRPDVPLQWCELARPQIHGYDQECVAVVQAKRHRFISGAEEKIFRVFDAPESFVHNLKRVVGSDSAQESDARPLGANVPTLGLSNKPVYTQHEAPPDTPATFSDALSQEALPADPVFIDRPPFEEELLQSTLWPEVQKLYGHGNYTFCLCCSNDGKLVATTVRAKSDPVQAAVRVWSTDTWKTVQVLSAHKLTVTDLSFSPDDRFLLTAGRDRQVGLFARTDDVNGEAQFELLQRFPKAHGRIVWSCGWSPDGSLFVTGSRDKSFKIWGKDPSGSFAEASVVQSRKVAVTAVAFGPDSALPLLGDHAFGLAVGYEDGIMELWGVSNSGECALLAEFDESICHCEAVKCIRWRPGANGCSAVATCSSDHTVRVFGFDVNK